MYNHAGKGPFQLSLVRLTILLPALAFYSIASYPPTRFGDGPVTGGYHAWSVGVGNQFAKLSFWPGEHDSTSIPWNVEHLSYRLLLIGVAQFPIE